MVRIYDTRDRSKAQLVIAAHDADVNVISWNALTSYMLASGGDDGALRIWDLRALPTYVANFTFHKQPITSVEWCPQESSMLATCSEVREGPLLQNSRQNSLPTQLRNALQYCPVCSRRGQCAGGGAYVMR